MDDENNTARNITVGAILLLILGAGGLIYFFGGNNPDEVVVTPEPQVVAQAPIPEPEPEPYAEPEPEIIAVPEPAPEPEVVEIMEEAIPAPLAAVCSFPGDGFVQYPHGFQPTGQYVAFEAPVQTDGYRGRTLPARADAEAGEQACVVVTFDISVEGKPINLSVLDVQPAGADSYYETAALEQVRSLQYKPGERNQKPVRIDNNFLELRFSENAD